MPSQKNPLIAAAFMLLASSFIAGTTVLAKLLGSNEIGAGLHPLQISHGRFLFAFLAISTVVAITRPSLQTENLSLHIARSVSGWTGISFLFGAVTFIPLTDATAISFLNPVFAMFLAIPLLGEKVGPWRWAAAAIALTGAVVLLQPGGENFHPAVFLAMMAAFILGLEVTLIKRLTGREAPLQILFINNGIGLAVATVAVLWVFTAPTYAQWLALGALGILMAFAQACFIQAMKRADASFIVPFSYATLVFAGLYDFAIFQVIPAPLSLLGAAIIVAGGALLAWREGRNAH